MDVALPKCKLEKATHYKELLDKTEEAKKSDIRGHTGTVKNIVIYHRGERRVR